VLTDRAKALRPAVQAASDAGGLDAICELIVTLTAPLEARVAELEKRLNMNSSNSSKPPSSDGLKRKTKSQRPKNTGRKPGGQPGHIGQTLQQNPTPDISQSISLDRCPDCDSDLRDEPVDSEEKRQVFDLPPIAMEVDRTPRPMQMVPPLREMDHRPISRRSECPGSIRPRHAKRHELSQYRPTPTL
jgi:hypothetical protein